MRWVTVRRPPDRALKAGHAGLEKRYKPHTEAVSWDFA